MHLVEPDFPPLLTGHGVNAPKDPFGEAVRGAKTERFGAGDLIWARRVDRLDCAIVLEPTVSPERTVEILFTALVAFGDAVGSIAPPEVAVEYNWPDIILVNGAKAGRAKFEMSSGRDETGSPHWAVVGLTCAIHADLSDPNPGADASRTTLWDEGCAELDRTMILNSFARHFLSWVDTWQEDGFKPVHDLVALRTPGLKSDLTLATFHGIRSGTPIGLDDHGNLLLKEAGEISVIPVRDMLDRGRLEIA